MPRPPLTNAAYGILPTLGVVRLKRTTSHRGALNYIHENGGMLRNRYKMILYPGVLKQDRDWMVSMCKHFRKAGV